MYQEYINKYKQQFLEDLNTLVSIPSVSDETAPKENMPFGKEVANAFDAFAEIAKRLGFKIETDNGYAISADYLNGDEYVGILGHLDVVPAGDLSEWENDPYSLTIKDDVLYGRGVNDDKGPLLANLYAVRILRDMGYEFKLPVKVIAGGAEETTWNCMKHYFKSHKQPRMAYSPDGNFPIVNGEKGIVTYRTSYPKTAALIQITGVESTEQEYTVPDYLRVTLKCSNCVLLPRSLQLLFENGTAHVEFLGKSALTRNPQRADNALFKFARFVYENETCFDSGIVQLSKDMLTCLLQPYGQDCGIYYRHEEMGTTSIAAFDFKASTNSYTLKLDLRYPEGIDTDIIEKELKKRFPSLEKIREKRLLYVRPDSELIQKLSSAYENVMNEKAETLTKGGASYARVLDNGIAFGATFDGYDTKPHQPDENMRLSDLLKAMEIYCESIRLLACEIM